MIKLRMIGCVLLCGMLAACSSSDNGSKGAASSTTPEGGSPGPSGSSTGCTVTFGGDASSVKATNCSQLGPLSSDATSFEFHGDADGLDAPSYSFTVKYPNGITAKTYQTSDLYYVSDNLGVTATDKNYYVDFDSRDATKDRHGSVTTTFTSDTHGTIDITLDSDDTPPAHATVHVVF